MKTVETKKKAGRPAKKVEITQKEVSKKELDNAINTVEEVNTSEISELEYYKELAQKLYNENQTFRMQLNQINRVHILLNLLETHSLEKIDEDKIVNEILISLGYRKPPVPKDQPNVE